MFKNHLMAVGALVLIGAAGNSLASGAEASEGVTGFEQQIFHYLDSLCQKSTEGMNLFRASPLDELNRGHIAAAENCQQQGGLASVSTQVSDMTRKPYDKDKGEGVVDATLTFNNGTSVIRRLMLMEIEREPAIVSLDLWGQ